MKKEKKTVQVNYRITKTTADKINELSKDLKIKKVEVIEEGINRLDKSDFLTSHEKKEIRFALRNYIDSLKKTLESFPQLGGLTEIQINKTEKLIEKIK